METKIAAVILDMDGTTLDTERVNLWAWQQAMADFGFEAPDALFVKTVGLTDQATNAVYRSALGPAFPVEQVRARELHYIEQYLGQQGAPLKPGVQELLDLLDELTLPRAIASTAPRWEVERRLASVNLLSRFDAIVGGDEVKQGKPAPDIFWEAARRLQVPPETCLVVEDSEAGVQGARAAGMTPILVPDLRPPSPLATALACQVVLSLHDVAALLREWHERQPDGQGPRPREGSDRRTSANPS